MQPVLCRASPKISKFLAYPVIDPLLPGHSASVLIKQGRIVEAAQFGENQFFLSADCLVIFPFLDLGMDDEGDDDPVPLPNVNAAILKKVRC